MGLLETLEERSSSNDFVGRLFILAKEMVFSVSDL